MLAEDARVPAAVASARGAIARTIEMAAERLGRGGRLIYVGAGTSGRLAALDAAECPPTFQCPPEQVQAVLAGGPRAATRSIEGAEDSAEDGRAAMDERGVAEPDLVLGISAGGTTPFVHAALERAAELGAATAFLACVPREEAPDRAQVSIRIPTGAEVVAGSTRLKAGTATKLALNAISTLTMARLGKVHGNLMVDLDTRGSAKLIDRGRRIVVELTGLEAPEAASLLERADGRVKLAVLMHRAGLDPGAARARLRASGGSLRRALGEKE